MKIDRDESLSKNQEIQNQLYSQLEYEEYMREQAEYGYEKDFEIDCFFDEMEIF